ncbi:MAG: hypothetical protein AAGL90_01280 [Pseudomonadota bacterium]
MEAVRLLKIVTKVFALIPISVSGFGFAAGQRDAIPVSLCEMRFSEHGIDVFVTSFSANRKRLLESDGPYLIDPLAPRTARADTYITFAVEEERFGVGGLAQSQKRELTLHITSDGARRPTNVTIYFDDIEAATAESLSARHLECRLALDGEPIDTVQALTFERSPYTKEWSASCGTKDPDNMLGMVDIGIVDADTREPVYRGRFGTHIPPDMLNRIASAIRSTSQNAVLGACDID